MSEQCYLCQSKELIPLSDRGRGNIPLSNKVCKVCGLAQRSPMPSIEEVRSYYIDGAFIDENQDRNFTRLFKRQYSTCSLRASILRGTLLENNLYKGGPIRILEIGSHIGTFLAVCNEVFPDAEIFGIEPDASAVEFSKTVSKAKVYKTMFEDFCHTIRVEKFDVVVSFAVLEHIYDPLGFMKMIKEIIKPGGSIFFEVPDIHSHSTGWPFWYDWYIKEHLFHFSAPTLTRLFGKSGFLIKKTQQVKTPRVFAVASECIPREAREAKDDYKKVLQSHEAFKKKHLIRQFKSPIKFLKLLLFILLGHKKAFALMKYLKGNISKFVISICISFSIIFFCLKKVW